MALTKKALPVTTPTTAPIVTHAGVTVTVTLDGDRTYVLAAPVFSVVGDFLEEQARRGAPGAADVLEAYRQALEAMGEGTEALTAYEDAEDAWVSFSNIHIFSGPDATDEIKREAVGLNLDMIKARRARDRAISKVEKAPEVLDLKAKQQSAQWKEHCGLVALLVQSWEGPGLVAKPDTVTPEAVAASLPMGDVAALAKRAVELMQPTAELGKA